MKNTYRALRTAACIAILAAVGCAQDQHRRAQKILGVSPTTDLRTYHVDRNGKKYIGRDADRGDIGGILEQYMLDKDWIFRNIDANDNHVLEPDEIEVASKGL